MDLIKTGRGITQTIRNMSRLKEIITVFAKNGFDEFIVKTGIHEKIPNFVLPKKRLEASRGEYDEHNWPESIGYRLRRSFEELGPAFVKLGQLISTREDMFPPEFVAEMRKLQDQVQGIKFEDAVSVINNSLGKSYGEVFAEIQNTPIGTASIGVVYRGKLLDGSPVVIKVRRPGIEKIIKTDFSLLGVLVAQVERASPEFKRLGVGRLVRDFGVHLQSELDYRVEALNAQRLKAIIEKLDKDKIFYLPKVYSQFTTDEILVLEFIDGIPFSDSARVATVSDVIHSKLEKGISVFVHTILSEGFFHADLHGGNFFLMPDKRIGIIDFGSVGILSKKSRENLVAILYALVTHNYDNLVCEFLDVAEYDNIPDMDALTRDVKDVLSPFVGLTVQQINLAQIFRLTVSTLVSHEIFLPREWLIVFRAMVALDGVGKALKMDFDVFSIIDRDIRPIMTELYSKEHIIEEAVWVGRDVLNSLKSLPRHARWFLREFAKRNYAFEIKQTGYEKQFARLSSTLIFLGVCFVSGILTLGGVQFYLQNRLAPDDFSVTPSVVLWVMATLLFAWGLLGIRKKK